MMIIHKCNRSMGRNAKTSRFLASGPFVRRLFIAILLSLVLTSVVHASDVTLSWDDPNNDPSAVAGYNVYYWQSEGPSQKVNAGLQTSYTLRNLTDGQTYSFAVTAYDDSGNESSQSPVISETLIRNNTTPVANNGTLSVTDGQVASGMLSGSDADGDPLTYHLATAARLGVVTITDASSGAYTYTPTGDAGGSSTLELPIASAQASGDDGNVAANTLDGDLGTRWSANGDGQWIEYDLGSQQTISEMTVAWYRGDQRVAFFDIDVSSDGSTWTTVFNGQSSGTTLESETITFSPVQARYVRYIGHGNSSNGWNSLTEVDVYTSGPSTAASDGTDTFTFTVHDGKVASAEATITVTLTSGNTPPVANNGTLSVTGGQVASGMLSGSDADGDPLTYRLISTGSLGTVTLTDASSGTYTYTPNANVTGTDAFTFVVSDGQSTSAEATITVSITATPVNKPPVALDGTLSTSEDTPAKGILLANNDLDGGSLTYRLVSTGSLGTATLTNAYTGAYTYTPNLNANGTDKLTFTANDGVYESNVATVTVTVGAVNDQPVAANDSGNTNEDEVVTLNVLGNDSDVDGDAVTIASITQGANGRSVLQGGGSISYTPNANYHGSDSFTYTVSDGHGGTATGTVSVTVRSVNDAPVASNGSLSAAADTAVSGTLSASDVDGDTLTYRLTSTGSKGTATLDDARSGAFTYTADADADGTDTLSFVANDGTVDSNTATITVTIKAANNTLVMEVGEISVDSGWTPVTFQKDFTEPVVVAKPMGHGDRDPAVLRIRNVTPNGFEIRVQEWDYLDGTHAAETVAYIVVERGFYTLPDGTQVEADTVNTNAASAFGAIAFRKPFKVVPVVLTAVTSVNEADAVTTRVQNVTAQGFEARLQEQEGNVQEHVTEQMAYLAWTPSSGTLDGWDFEVVRTPDSVDHTFYTVQYATTFINLPMFIGDMQTMNGTDTANLRWEHKDFYGIDIRVDEEQSGDPEIDHAPEAVGYIAFASNDTGINADADGDGLSNVEELQTYGTDPALADTDQDGIADGAEVAYWNAHPSASWDGDVDGDGLINLLDLDSDDDGILDGEEIKQGFDPADPFSPNGPQEIVLTANGRKSRGSRTVDLAWTGATGNQVRVLRARNGGQDGSFIINNNGAYRDSISKRGDYTYQVCETDGSLCSSEVGANF